MIEYKLVSFFFYLDFKRKEKIILYVLVKDYKLRRFSFDLKNKNISIFSPYIIIKKKKLVIVN